MGTFGTATGLLGIVIQWVAGGQMQLLDRPDRSIGEQVLHWFRSLTAPEEDILLPIVAFGLLFFGFCYWKIHRGELAIGDSAAGSKSENSKESPSVHSKPST